MRTNEPNLEEPLPEEVERAKQAPNGWVYRIAGRFGPTDPVPPEAIVGAWKVDARGCIVGAFIKNGRYDPKRWPSLLNGRSNSDSSADR